VVTALDESTLGSTWNTSVAASLVQPGLSVLADIDPTQQIAEGNEADNSFPRDGNPASVNVGLAPPFNVRFVPIRTSNNQTGNVSLTNKDSYVAEAMRLFPLFNYDADVRAAYTTSAGSLSQNTSWEQIVTELEGVRVADNNPRYYYGVLAAVQGVSSVCGMASIPGFIALGLDQCGASIAAHEWGHNFGRLHAPCGDPDDVDPFYPYPQGRIGRYGFDITSQTLRPPTAYYDIMSYCNPLWISDYTYSRVMTFRAALGTPKAHDPAPAVLVWGRIEDGRVLLEPAFELVTAPSLPETSGQYRVEALDASGRTIFSYSFEPQRHGDGDGAHFAFAVPVTWSAGDGPATLRVVGPQGVAASRSSAAAAAVAGAGIPLPVASAVRPTAAEAIVRWNADVYPMVMVRDGATGEVLSFARDGGVTVHTTGADVELVFFRRRPERDAESTDRALSVGSGAPTSRIPTRPSAGRIRSRSRRTPCGPAR
jgi:hypothetical protein